MVPEGQVIPIISPFFKYGGTLAKWAELKFDLRGFIGGAAAINGITEERKCFRFINPNL
jgi:hypothetical protein